MPVRKILLYPDPFLRRASKQVHAFGDEIAHAIRDMTETMHSLHHCVGIAANQVGIDHRIFAMDTSRRDKRSQGLIVMVNPILQKKEGNAYTKEGCLSLPSFLGRVGRAEKVTVSAHDAEGREKAWTFTGLEAICVQHEMDHLDGMLFIDRLNSLRMDLSLRAKG